MLWEFMQYKTQTRTQESSGNRNSWKQLQIGAPKSYRSRLPALGSWHRNLEVVDNYTWTPVNESNLICCTHFFLSFLFLISCFPVLKANPSNKKCEVTWLNSLLGHSYHWCSYWMSWLKCLLKASVERWGESWWGHGHHSSKMFAVAALGRDYAGAICSSWFCFKGL